MLEVRGVRSTFGSVCALDDVSLSVAKAEFVCILGPSGCGKSTLLNSIAGFVIPDAGKIMIDGSPAERSPPNRRPMAMVFQSYALFPHMTVFENIAFGLRIRKDDNHVIAQKVRGALDLVKLVAVESRYPRQLSGGQQQRVALARALVVEPKLLLLDEPFSNLDAKLRESVRLELKELQRKIGITTIFVTHDQEEAFDLGDRIVLMNQGRIEQIGTAAELYENPKTAFAATFIGRANLLEGEIVRRLGHEAVIRVSNLLIRVAAAEGLVGDSVSVIVRPEQISVGAHTNGDVNVFDATVRLASHLGSGIRYMLDIGDVPLMVIGANTRNGMLSAGEIARVSFGKELVVLAKEEAVKMGKGAAHAA